MDAPPTARKAVGTTRDHGEGASLQAEAGLPAGECRSMTDVRREIDRIDRVLVALMAERQGYIAAAARIKGRAEDVRDEGRIADVLGKVLAACGEAGLSKRIAEPVWRELIERSIEHEHELWRSFRIRNDL